MTKKEKQEMLFADIYDILKVLALNDKQNDKWEDMLRAFAKMAKQDWKKFLRNKNIEWDGDNNVIRVGRDFKIALIIK